MSSSTVNERTTVIELAAAAGAAVNLWAAIEAKLLAMRVASGPLRYIPAKIIIGVAGAGTCWLRSAEGCDPNVGGGLAAGKTGTGFPIAQNTTLELDWQQEPTDTLGYECAGVVNVLVFYKDVNDGN